MIAAEFYSEIERRIANLDNDFFIPSSEILMATNKAIKFYVQNAYRYFEQNEENRKRLIKIVRTQRINSGFTQNTNFSNLAAYDVVLPQEAVFIVMESARLQKTSNPTIKYVSKVTPVNLDVMNANLNNPYKVPYKYRIWRIESDGVNKIHTLILPDGFELEYYIISYLEIPYINSITDTTDLNQYFDEVFQYEIIPIAVEFSIEPYRNIGKNENSNNEKNNKNNEDNENNK